MQELFKIELPTSPLSSVSQPIINPKNLKDLMQIVTKLLLEGQESAQIIRTFINKRLGLKVEDHHHDNQVDLDYHSLVTLNSFENVLSILKSYDFDQNNVIRKRKLDSINIIDSIDNIKVEDPSRVTITKERRGCYKRRRDGQTWTSEATDLVDDGHAWRKYGQKDILHSKYPRHYYRCTHKHDQHCQATKQVQQISENPTKYNIIYNGHHTCTNLPKTSSFLIDPQQDSSIFLSFDTTHNNHLSSSSFFSSSFSFNNNNNNNNHAMVKQEYTTSIKEELPISQSQPLDLDDHHSGTHSSSCSENLPSSSDLTSSNTSVSDQGDSYAYELDEDLMNFYMDHTHSLLDEIMNS